MIQKMTKAEIQELQKAAEQGDAVAQGLLGLQSLLGEDHKEAYAWFNVSAANGCKDSSKSRDIIAKKMKPDQIAEAQALSAKWFDLYQPKDN
ncbi:hypothetical protein OAG77_00330 [bacterium]|nr:hypothetical protein [bacterium]